MHDDVASALAKIVGGSTADEAESATIEFKSDRGDVGKDVADAALCFANSSGGFVIVGVDDKLRGSQAITGTTADPDQIRKRVFDLTSPHVVVEPELITHGGSRLLCVRVPAGIEVHSDPQGRTKWRVGRDCLPMSAAEVGRLRDDRSGVDWSAQVTGIGIDAIRPEPIALARAMLSVATTSEQRRLARAPMLDLLTALGVAESSGLLRRAGDLLFVNDSHRPLITYQYRRTPAGEPKQVLRRADTLLSVFSGVLETISARSEASLVLLRDGQQLALQDFPELAVREVLANALMHRDYRLQEAVEVEHSPQQLVVVSPGPLVSGVTPENILTTPSKPRNKCLAGALRMLGIAEETGRGVDRIYRELIRAGKDVPKIEDTGATVRVFFAGGPPKANIAKVVAQLPADEREDTDALLVLFALCAQRTITATTFNRVVQRTVDETELSLRRLASSPVNLIETTRESARRSHPAYRLRSEALRELGSAVPYQRRSVDNIDQRVINHVREYESVTNRAVQNLFEVSLQRARAILADMVHRKLLKKISDHQRGPGVEYGPGTAFPRPPQKRSAKKR